MMLVKLTNSHFKYLLVNCWKKTQVYNIESLHSATRCVFLFIHLSFASRKILVIFRQFLKRNIVWINFDFLYLAKKSPVSLGLITHEFIEYFMIFRVCSVIFFISSLVSMQDFFFYSLKLWYTRFLMPTFNFHF